MADDLQDEDDVKAFMDRHEIAMWNKLHDRIAAAIESAGYVVMTVECHPLRWRLVMFSNDTIVDRSNLRDRIVQILQGSGIEVAELLVECNESMAILHFSLDGGERHLGITYYSSHNGVLQRERWEFHTGR